MEKLRLTLPGLAALCAALVVGAIVLAVGTDTVIRRSIISSGGGRSASAEVRARGLLGQAITGRSVGPSTQILGGWWAATGSQGVSRAGFIPLIMVNSCGQFLGAWECEDNDTPGQANGPLRLGRPLQGRLTDANESASDQHTEDWFYFDWSGEGSLTVDVTDFSPIGQVILYYESVGQGIVAQEADQPDGAYHLAYNGSAGPGRYLVRLFVPGAARSPGAPDYTLVVNN